MKQKLMRIFALAGLCLLLPLSIAEAATLMPDASVKVAVPDDWEKVDGNFSGANAEVSRIFDCTSESPSQLKTLGWKSGSDGQITAAFCISYQLSGIGKMRNLLKSSQGKEREAIAAKFLDSFASKLKSEYTVKRKMALSDLSAALMEAGNDFVVIVDGKITDGGRRLFNSSTVYLHGDSLLRISFVYRDSTPPSIVDQLDAIPLSVEWR